MTEWARSVLEDFGYVGLCLLMLVENVFPPIPSEVVVPFAGYTTTQGELHIVGVIAVATLGSLLGALLLYGLGAWLGRDRVMSWVGRHGQWLTLRKKDVERADRWFEEHGSKAVLLCRCVPGLRSLISIPAGVVRMPMGRFLLLTTLGTVVWCAALALAGLALGRSYDQVGKVLDPVLWGLLGAGLVWYVVRVMRQRRRGAD